MAYATSLHEATEIIIDLARAAKTESQTKQKRGEPKKGESKKVVSDNTALGIA